MDPLTTVRMTVHLEMISPLGLAILGEVLRASCGGRAASFRVAKVSFHSWQQVGGSIGDCFWHILLGLLRCLHAWRPVLPTPSREAPS